MWRMPWSFGGTKKEYNVMSSDSLYQRLGGYDAISAVVDDLLPRLEADPVLGRFWEHRSKDGIAREKQLLVDYLSSNAGGPMYYTGRDMSSSHKGMRISEADWQNFLGHLNKTLDAFQVPQQERDDVINFIESTKADITEA
jgi:hemoglobin